MVPLPGFRVSSNPKDSWRDGWSVSKSLISKLSIVVGSSMETRMRCPGDLTSSVGALTKVMKPREWRFVQ